MSVPPAQVLMHVRRLIGPPCELADAELLDRFVRLRDESAFAALVDRHGPLVLGVCRRVLADASAAEDAFQAVFLVLARKAGSLRRPEALAGWLFGVARRLALKARGRRGRRREQTLSADAACPRPDVLDQLTARDLLVALDEEVERLPEVYRLPVVLCCLEGHTQEEAARVLACSPGAVKGRLERGRRRIHERLARRGLTLMAALGALELSRGPAAAVPARLAADALGTATSGAAPASVQALAAGASGALAKWSLAVVLGLGLVAAGVAARRPPAEEPTKHGSDREEEPRLDRHGDPLPPGAVARLGTVRLRHGDSVMAVAFSANGKTMASAGRGLVRLWEAATGREVRTFSVPQKTIFYSVALSSDGKRVAAGTWFGPVHVWDAQTGRHLHEMLNPGGSVNAVAFSPDGKMLAAGSAFTGQVTLWDQGGKEIRRLGERRDGTYEWFPDATVRFSPDGKLLASARGPTVFLWTVADGSLRHEFGVGNGRVAAVAFAPSGKTLAVAGNDQVGLRLWDVAEGKERLRIEGHRPRSRIAAVAFAPDGKTLASACEWRDELEPGIRLWDAATGAGVGRLVAPGPSGQEGTYSLAFSPDGRRLVDGSPRGQVRLWELPAKGPDAQLPLGYGLGHQHAVEAVAVAPDGKRFATGAADGSVCLWRADTGKRSPRGARSSRITGVVFSPDGYYLASADTDHVVVWDIEGQEVHRLPGNCVAFSPNGKLLATGGFAYDAPGSNRGVVRLWELATGKQVRQMHGHSRQVRSLAFSPDGRLLASGGGGTPTEGKGDLKPESNTVRLWDVATGRELLALGGGDYGVHSLAFSPDGRSLAGARAPDGADDGQAPCVWEVTTGQERCRLTGHASRVDAVAFAPGGRLLASASWDGTVRLWDAHTGEERDRLEGHRAGVTSLAFGPGGRTLVSGSRDTTALVWDLSGRAPAAKGLARAVTARQLERWWDDLAGADAGKAYQAIDGLAAAGPRAVALLKDRLRPPGPVEPRRLAALVADLDDARFATRQQAEAELERLGEQAEEALREALRGQPSPEVRRRAEGLLTKLSGVVLSGERLRGVRAVEALQRIGSAQASEVLRALAAGPPESRVTREAKAALASGDGMR